MRSIGALGLLAMLAACSADAPLRDAGPGTFTYQGNPLVRDRFTADPAPSDGTSWLFWGNAELKFAPLAPDMISFTGPIETIDMPDFEEGPWVFQRGDVYYLAYASMDRAISPDERISYATAPSIRGPWTWRGEINGSAANSFTIHPGIVEFLGEWYLFYHVGTLTVGDQTGAIGRRAVAMERMQFATNGLILPVEQTAQGLLLPR
ncbi:MAG TPA: family 43 glycosylhydrolase [Paracoccaceae bacterium]|nr:family 43 glycosylhydrolase [Paracoccaceae bacterium]